MAIDFGTSNTVVAAWDESDGAAAPLHVGEVGRFCIPGEASERVSVVPSLIHYASQGGQWIGNQVLEQNLGQSPRTFRGMKRYISHRSPVRRHVDGRDISHFDAGRDFLGGLFERLADETGLGPGEEIALTVPVESFEHYEHWLGTVVENAGYPRVRLIDEPSAAALGYQETLRAGDACVVFDFGGGTLDVAVVVIEDPKEGGASTIDVGGRSRASTIDVGAVSGRAVYGRSEAGKSTIDAGGGRRCRVLGKGGADLGGVVLDQWLFSEVLRREGRRDSDDDVRATSRALLAECERVKEALSSRERADLSVINPETGAALYAEFTRTELEDLLEQHEAYTTITQTVRRAMVAAAERGYSDDDISAVLMVGGSSLIPSVQRTVHHIFGRERVRLSRPLDAVARGAAAFVAGLDFCDHIQHDYAIRYVDPAAGGYAYRPLVKRGTPYPTREPVAEMTIKAGSNGQTHLGLAIFEVSERQRESAMELVFDASGAARLAKVTPEQGEERTHFWMNQHQPTFLRADPPGRKGEPRFRVRFSIDANKRLTVTAVDLVTQQTVYQDYPVIKLS